MNKLRLLTVALSLLGIGQSVAQTPSTVQLLPVDGYSPTAYFNEFFNSYYDARLDRIYFHTRDTLHMWDMSEKRWTMVRTTQFEDPQVVMDIDTVNNRVLIWSGGAGMVYATDIDWRADPVRIDQSFNHRNQYEHGHMISPLDGRIMLFGGYGFWQDKDIFTQFDDVSGHWDLIVWKGNMWPSKRITPSLNYWRSGNKVILFGGRTTTEPNKPYVTFRKSLYDIWTFDLERTIWEHHGDLVFNEDDLVNNYLMLGFMATPRNGVLQDENLLIGMDQYNSNDRNSIMYAIDLESMQGSFIDVNTGALSKFERLLAYFLNERTRQMYLLWTPLPTNNRAAPVYVSTIDLPSANFIRANIRRMIALSENNWDEPVDSGSAWYLIPILVAASAIPLLYWLRRRRWHAHSSSNQIETPIASTDSGASVVQLISSDTGYKIIHDEKDLTSNFSDDEVDLLMLLCKQYHTSNRYLSTEQIEQAIWEHGFNPDYSRKMRNQIQKKLEDNLQLVLPKPDGSVWIQGRNEPSDKRRKEYALNPLPFRIEISG